MTFLKGNKLGQKNKGKKHSDKSRRNMSEAHKGQKWSDEQRVKMHKILKGRVFTEEHRRRISEASKGKPRPELRGEKNGRYNPVSSENRRWRGRIEYKLWRTAVFERDNYTCIWCGARSGNGKAVILNADHIKPFAHYPELRFAIDNGRTLCIDCHKTTDTYFWKISKVKK